jgi:DNA-binding CsgD family transcriptional regulator/type II secretory pathway predicted ATPase ExeA
MHDLPAPLRLASPFPFVGRASELATLKALLPTARAERGRLVLLSGASGSGKSRLVRELAAAAHQESALVLYGSCDTVLRTPYGPFVAVLERLAQVIDHDELSAMLGVRGGLLARLIPALPADLAQAAAPVAVDPDTERHRLHTLVTELLEAGGHRSPVLLIVEDVHWADLPSLLLLRHLARAVGSSRVIVLGTFRDTEADVPPELAEALADLRRSDDVLRLRLAPLSDDDLREFVRSAAAPDTSLAVDELSAAIGELTGGNAFLVCELWRALVETGFIETVDGRTRLTRPLVELGTPESVREVVSQRLTRLAPETITVLELAATAGSEFELGIVRRACGLSEAELLAAVDEAVRSGIAEELSRRRLAYRFTHELVRRAVLDRLSAAREAELHLRIGEAQEAEGATSAHALADLARHFEAAAPLGETKRAIEYNLLAARAAADALAFDEAAARLRAALDVGIPSDAVRGEVLIDLGMAAHRAGKVADALGAFRGAAVVARERQDAELLARTAIGFEEATWRPQIPSGDVIELLQEAAGALGDDRPDLRLGLLGGLARAFDLAGEHIRAAHVRTEAVALARRLDDRSGLAKLLTRSYWARGNSSIQEILEMLAEAEQLARALGDNELRAEAIAWRVTSCVALADINSARHGVTTLRQIADRTGQPFVLHMAEHFGSAIALADGRFAQAEAMSRRSEEAGRLLTGRDASATHGIQMFNLRREQGRLSELAPVVRMLAGHPERNEWQPGLVALLAELGMEADVRSALDEIARNGLDQFSESLWLASLTYLADASAAVDHERVATLVYSELESSSGTIVMIGHLVSYHGSADRYLGMLARTLGEWDRAEEHFERALALNRSMSAATWLAHTEYEYARLLIAQGSRSSATIAALLSDADKLAGGIGMPALSARIQRVHSPAPRASHPDGLSPREAQILRLVARGLSNRDIGAELFISEHTAANHIRNILRKTGCANRTEAASYAHRHALADG